MSSSKRNLTGTVVPNARGLTDFIAGSSIETRIVLAATIGTRDVTNTRGVATLSLRKQNKTENENDNNDNMMMCRIAHFHTF